MNEQPVYVILDTDFSTDVDDVGAVAVLHSLAQQGDVRILAMMISSADPWSAQCLGAINNYFGKSDIPIGQVQIQDGISETSKYTKIVAKEFGSNTNDNKVVDAVLLYRKILSEQSDKSVTIITVGYLTNLSNLLKSQPDSISSMSGEALVAKKVKKLISMGGQYPSGKEWNFYRDQPSTKWVVEKWPTPIIFCGYEIGKDILTGKTLEKTIPTNPVRRSYELYNSLSDRPSWDQVTVYFAINERYGLFNESYYSLLQGKNAISPDGSNKWENSVNGERYYMKMNVPKYKIKKIIENRMVSAVEAVTK